MGGVKRKATVVVKKESKYKIPVRFDCPLCDAKHSIGVKLFRNNGSARVYCRACQAGQGKEYTILPLEKPVDVFFRFREELLQQDREFLVEKQIGAGTIPEPSALEQLAAPAGLTSAAAADIYARGALARAATLHDIDLGDEDDDDAVLGVHGSSGALGLFFEDGDTASRTVEAIIGQEMDELLAS